MPRRNGIRRVVDKPITLKGRIYLSLVMVLVALVLGFATSLVLYQVTRTYARNSDLLGSVLCGSGQHVDDTRSDKGSRRFICVDANGVEVSPRNNLVAVKMALPFIILYAGTGLLVAWTIGASARREEEA